MNATGPQQPNEVRNTENLVQFESQLKEKYFLVARSSVIASCAILLASAGFISWGSARAAIASEAASQSTKAIQALEGEARLAWGGIKEVHDALKEGQPFTLKFGDPITWKRNSDSEDDETLSPEIVAPADGVVVVTNGGPGYGATRAHIRNRTSGLRVWVDPSFPAKARGSSYVLIARKGDKFSIWASQETITVRFFPLQLEFE